MAVGRLVGQGIERQNLLYIADPAIKVWPTVARPYC